MYVSSPIRLPHRSDSWNRRKMRTSGSAAYSFSMGRGKSPALAPVFQRAFRSFLICSGWSDSSRARSQGIGAFLVTRRKLFDALHGFDAQFFVYFEDLDLSYRAYQAGSQSYYLATA